MLLSDDMLLSGSTGQQIHALDASRVWPDPILSSLYALLEWQIAFVPDR